MTEAITDIWFRAGQKLDGLAMRLGWQDLTIDAENDWAWVIGTFNGERLEITRLHRGNARSTDTRIFHAEGKILLEPIVDRLVATLREIIDGPLFVGRWQYQQGNEFLKIALREIT